jgi:hypothetical protein
VNDETLFNATLREIESRLVAADLVSRQTAPDVAGEGMHELEKIKTEVAALRADLRALVFALKERERQVDSALSIGP